MHSSIWIYLDRKIALVVGSVYMKVVGRKLKFIVFIDASLKIALTIKVRCRPHSHNLFRLLHIGNLQLLDVSEYGGIWAIVKL